jgi:hypothetical protein
MIRTVPGIRIVAPALLLAAAAAGAAPCDTREPLAGAAGGAGWLPPPFTAAQLREALLPGLEILVRTESPATGSFSRLMRVEAADEETVTISEHTVEVQMRGQLPDTTSTTTWESLRDHGCFPADRAVRERVTLATAFGQHEGWRYRLEDEALLLEFEFADDLPGLPVRWQRTEANMLLSSATQMRRSDQEEAEEEALAPEGFRPDGGAPPAP